MVSDLPVENQIAIQQICDLLPKHKVNWLIGGSCGLVLQGVAVAKPPRDLDIYADAKAASMIHEVLQMYATDQPVKSETGIYVSVLSHYQINEVSIELVGSFEVHALQSSYQVEVDHCLVHFGVSCQLGDRTFGLMPLAHELVFNIMRNRPDRYRAIAEKMKMNLDGYLAPLNKILERNAFGAVFLNELNELL